MIRTELSRFMTGEQVKLVAELLGFGRPRSDGQKNVSDINPVTGTIVPCQFFDRNIPIMPLRLMDKTTIVKPLSIIDKNKNEILINNVDHMWLSEDIFQSSSKPSKGTVFEIWGHIQSYCHKDKTLDFCFTPSSIPVIISKSHKIASLSCGAKYSRYNLKCVDF